METTPAVGVGAGRIGGRAASVPWSWRPAFRSALLVPVIVASLVASFAAVATNAQPASAAKAINSLGLRATYDVQANISWENNSLTVSSVAHVQNTTAKPVGRLAFNLLPLRLGRVDSLVADVAGTPVNPVVSDQTLIVPLGQSLAPGAEIDVTVGYRAFFNSAKTGGKNVLLMRKSGIAVAYRWIPWLSRQQQFNTPNFGETWVTAVSPRVTVTLNSDVALTYATSGVRTSVEGNVETFTATDVRDFNFSASPNYRVKKTSWNGIKVRVFYDTENPARLMTWTLRALKRFSAMVGPYPYSHLDVAETPAGAGMESPGLTWISADLSGSAVPFIVVHETAHQWFYAAVGNNQGTQPFLDEGLADFLTRDLLDSFRASKCAKARLDRPVYDYSAHCYSEVIYTQGGLFLRDYRTEVGNAAFWDGLQDFYKDFKFKIATTRNLLDSLDAASGLNGQQHADRFPSLY